MKLLKKTRIAVALGALLAVVAVQPASAYFTDGSGFVDAATYWAGGVKRAYHSQAKLWAIRDQGGKMYGFEIETSHQDVSTDGYCSLIKVEVKNSGRRSILSKEFKECNGIRQSVDFTTGLVFPVTLEPRYVTFSFGRTDGGYLLSEELDLWRGR